MPHGVSRERKRDITKSRDHVIKAALVDKRPTGVVSRYNWHEDEISGLSASTSSWRYYRIVLDEDRVAQLRTGQAGQTGTFTDVPADAWYAPYVNAAVEAGLMNGTGDGRFSPSKTLSMAEVVTLAARLHAQNSGATVPASAWETAAIFCRLAGLTERV